MTGNYTGSTPDDYDDDGREPDDADHVVTSTDQQIIEAYPEAPDDEGSEDESSKPPVFPIVPTSGAEAAAAAGAAAGAGAALGGLTPPDTPEVDPDSPDEDTPTDEAEAPEPHPPEEEPEDGEPEDDSHEEADEEDGEEPPAQDQTDTTDSVEDSPQDDRAESDSEDEDGDHEQDEEQDLEFTLQHFTDPLCVLSWQAEPILKRLEVRYGHALEIERQLVPVREFDAPEAMADRWAAASEKYGMPVDTQVWATSPPESTASANTAYLVASEQGDEIAETYLRRLWRAGFTEGTDITDRGALLSLAEAVGLNTHQMAERMDELAPRRSDDPVTTPQFRLDVLDVPGAWTSYPSEEIEAALLGAGVTPRLPPALSDFVADYGPVTTWEVMVVYEYDRETATEELSELERRGETMSTQQGGAVFWETS